jgi:hypothetical protein
MSQPRRETNSRSQARPPRRLRRWTCGAVVAAASILAIVSTSPALAAWSVVPSPNPTGANFSELWGVSCANSTSCIAVGGTNGGSLGESGFAELWNGTEWSVSTVPQPAGAIATRLQSVSCSSATACTAVGFYSSGSGFEPLGESWNGTEWSIQTMPKPPESTGVDLQGVSCAAAKTCIAVGSNDGPGGLGTARPIAERWDGKTWSVQATVTPSSLSFFRGVDCKSAKACTAVGENNVSETLIERWNGVEWQLQTGVSKEPSTTNSLIGISCASASKCEAVGSSHVGEQDVSLAEGWNGTEWALQTAAGAPGENKSTLNAVSCASSKACSAVGFYGTSSSLPATLANVWNGTGWSLETTPAPSGAISSELQGVSCISSTECVAVGNYDSGPARLTLIETKP